jgi:HSP20 family protein
MSLVPFRRIQTPAPAYTAGFDQLDRLFDRMFGNALTNLADAGPSFSGLPLRLDVAETEKSYHIEADLPGVEDKDVAVSLEDGVLTISGEKKQASETEGKTFHRTERSYGSFKRALALPPDADENGIRARMKNGVLEVEIAKSEQAKKTARRIAIET